MKESGDLGVVLQLELLWCLAIMRKYNFHLRRNEDKLRGGQNLSVVHEGDLDMFRWNICQDIDDDMKTILRLWRDKESVKRAK